jgi:hypothetical protein
MNLLGNRIIWFLVLVGMGVLIGYLIGQVLVFLLVKFPVVFRNTLLTDKTLSYVVPGFTILGCFGGLVGAIMDLIGSRER